MHFSPIVSSLALLAVTRAADKPWSTLTPSAAPAGNTDVTSSFGISVKTLATSTSSSLKKTTSASSAVPSVTASASNSTSLNTTSVAPTTSHASSIATKVSKPETSEAAKPEKSAAPAPAASGKGQGVIQIGDGQIQQHKRADAYGKTCKGDNVLTLTLKDSLLTDSHGRVGAIVAGRQFQFDGPPPQAGSIYAAGWSIVDGLLALGDQTTFYQCKSGDFSNLYDQSIGAQCSPIELTIQEFVDC